MKQKIAAFAGGEEIREPRDACQRSFLEQRLPSAPDFSRRRTEGVLRNKRTGRHNVASAGFTVKCKMHQAAGAQEREQNAPSLEGIGHVVQHAAGIDDVETASNRSKVENIGLRVVDAGCDFGRRLALGVAQAGQT